VGDLDATSMYFEVPSRSLLAPQAHFYLATWDLVSGVGADSVEVFRNMPAFPGGGIGLFSIQSAVIPEPSSVTLALMGAVGLLGYGWRRKRKRANAVS